MTKKFIPKPIKWILFAILIKALLFIYFSFSFTKNWSPEKIINGIFITGTDTPPYYKSIENLIDGHGYSFDGNKNFASRMPGLLPVYGPLYYLFGKETASFLIIIFQFLLDAVSVYYLARSALILFKERLVFYITFFMYSLNYFVSVYVHYGISESFGVSSLIFSFYFYLRASESGKSNQWLLSGIFLCWAVFMRPILGICVIIFMLFYIFYLYPFRKAVILSAIKNMIIFCLPLVIFISIWTVRNYRLTHEFVPTQTSYKKDYSSSDIAVAKMIVCWGGEIQFWLKGSEGKWFLPEGDKLNYDPEYAATNPFSDYVFTEDYNIDSLVILREAYRKSTYHNRNIEEKNQNINKAAEMADRYANSFIKHHPFHYYFLSKLRLIRKLVFITQTYDLPFTKNNLQEKLSRYAHLAFYYFVVLLGVSGVLLTFKNKNYMALIVSVIPWCLILVLSVFLGFTHNRYLAPAFPFFIVLASYSIVAMISYKKSLKSA